MFLINEQRRKEIQKGGKEGLIFKYAQCTFKKIKVSDTLMCFKKAKTSMSDPHSWLMFHVPPPHALCPWVRTEACGPQSLFVQASSSFILPALQRPPSPKANLSKWSLFIQFIKQEYLKGFHLEDLFCLALEGRPKFTG